MKLLPITVRNSDEFISAFPAIMRERRGVPDDKRSPPAAQNRHANNCLPEMFLNREIVIALLSYGTNLPDFFRRGVGYRRPYQLRDHLVWCYYRAAYYVDRILKGQRVGDLPVEFPTRIEMVIISRPPRRSASPCRRRSSRADEIIESGSSVPMLAAHAQVRSCAGFRTPG